MQENVIQLKDLEFTYEGASTPTLKIPELTISAGQKVFVFGPSGSGKTTLLEVLSGVLVPQQGQVQVAGVDLRSLSDSQRDQFRAQKVGYIFQGFNLLPYLNVRENIELPLQLKGASLEPLREWQQVLVARLGLAGLLEQSVQKLSVGQQQRVAVARALLGQPSLLLADEPTSSLDYDNREKFLQLLFELAKAVGTTVIFVSHDRSLEALFDKALSFVELNRVVSGVVK